MRARSSAIYTLPALSGGRPAVRRRGPLWVAPNTPPANRIESCKPLSRPGRPSPERRVCATRPGPPPHELAPLWRSGSLPSIDQRAHHRALSRGEPRFTLGGAKMPQALTHAAAILRGEPGEAALIEQGRPDEVAATRTTPQPRATRDAAAS